MIALIIRQQFIMFLKLCIGFLSILLSNLAYASIFDRVYGDDDNTHTYLDLEEILGADNKDESFIGADKKQYTEIESGDDIKLFFESSIIILNPNIGSRVELNVKANDPIEYKDMQVTLLKCVRDDEKYYNNYKALISVTRKNNNVWEGYSTKIFWIFSRYHKFSLKDKNYLILLQSCQ